MEAVDHRAVDERLDVDRRDAMLGLVAPHHLDPRLVGRELHTQVLLLEAADVDVLPDLQRRHDDRAVVGVVGSLPEDRAGVGRDGIHSVGLHEHQLPHPGRLDDRRRRVALLGGGAGPPQLLAGERVERHDMGLRRAGDDEQPVPVDERMARPAPQRCLRFVLLLQVLRPDHAAIGHGQAEEIPLGAERVDAVAVDRRRAARAGRIADRVGNRDLMLPQFLPRRLVEAEDALGARGGLPLEVVPWQLSSGHEIGDEHLAICDGHTGVAPGHRCPPQNLRPPGGKLVDNPLFAPDVVALRPHPLRPLVADGDRIQEERAGDHGDDKGKLASLN